MILPQAQDYEEVIIGACLIEKTAFDTAQQIVSDKMFYNTNNAKIFAAMQRLNTAGMPIDVLTVSSELKKSKELEAVGGDYYLSQFMSKIGSGANLEYHCQIVFQKFISRELIRMAGETQSRAFADIDDPDDILTDTNQQIEQIMELVAGVSENDSTCEVVKKALDEMYRRKITFAKGQSVGITTGFADLNRLLNGWQSEKLVILAARPAVGKTSVAVHFAKRAAQAGNNVVVFSLEMGAVELMDKIITSYAGVEPEKYAAGNLSQKEISEVENQINKILDLPITIDDKPNVTVEQIISKARLLKKRNKCDLVIVDYLQLVTPSSRNNRNREQEVTEMSRKLKVAAKSLKVPFIVLCQLNRDIEKRGKSAEPQLSDLRESGAIEQDADIVCFIHRPEMYNDEAEKNYLELIVRKHRGGKIGKVRVRHNGSMNEFFDYYVPQAEVTEKENSEMPF